jgi:hypothetical protein
MFDFCKKQCALNYDKKGVVQKVNVTEATAPWRSSMSRPWPPSSSTPTPPWCQAAFVARRNRQPPMDTFPDGADHSYMGCHHRAEWAPTTPYAARSPSAAPRRWNLVAHPSPPYEGAAAHGEGPCHHRPLCGLFAPASSGDNEEEDGEWWWLGLGEGGREGVVR